MMLLDLEKIWSFLTTFFNTGRPNKYHQKLNGTYRTPIDKIPFLDFMKADYAYTADFDWQVTSQDNSINDRIGNVIQNANTHNIIRLLLLRNCIKN